MDSRADTSGRPLDVPTLLTSKEAAAILRVKASWLERQAASRKVPFSMLGGCYRFTTEHLAQIVEIFEATPRFSTAEAPVSASPRRRRQPELPPPGLTPLRARKPRLPNHPKVAA